MFPVFQVKQCPELFIALENHMASSSSVTTVGTTLAGEFIAVQMCRSRPSVAGATEDLYIIDKVGIAHV
jgi:hypothetical protein